MREVVITVKIDDGKQVVALDTYADGGHTSYVMQHVDDPVSVKEALGFIEDALNG